MIQDDKYSIEEIAGTLFLKYGVLVCAVNIGEQGNITNDVRKHFEHLVRAGNQIPFVEPGQTNVDPPAPP